MPRICLPLLVVLVCGLAAPLATAQQDPFGGGPGAIPVQPRQAPTVTTPRQDNGLPGWQTALLLATGAGLLGGVAWLIVRDARSKAPAPDAARAADIERSRREREADHQRRKQGTRKKNRAARKARRQNRPR